MIQDLVNTYLTAKGFRKIKGSDHDATPILPLIMMDSAREWFDKYIKDVPCTQQQAKLKRRFQTSLRALFKEFFLYYNEEQRDEAIEMMDGFNEHISHDAEITFWQLTNVFKAEEFEVQKVMSAAMMVIIFCQSAQIIYGRVFRSKWNVAYENANIKACEEWIRKWKNSWYKGAPYNCNEFQMVDDAIAILCRKQINYLYTLIKNEEQV